MTADNKNASRVYVMLSDDDEVVGYLALAPHTVDREEVPKSLGHGAPDSIPAILLAKLAIDQSIQGQGLGRALLADALVTAVSAIKLVAGMYVVVDAIDDDAREFYVRHGFKSKVANETRLFQKASTIATSLGLDW